MISPKNSRDIKFLSFLAISRFKVGVMPHYHRFELLGTRTFNKVNTGTAVSMMKRILSLPRLFRATSQLQSRPISAIVVGYGEREKLIQEFPTIASTQNSVVYLAAATRAREILTQLLLALGLQQKPLMYKISGGKELYSSLNESSHLSRRVFLHAVASQFRHPSNSTDFFAFTLEENLKRENVRQESKLNRLLRPCLEPEILHLLIPGRGSILDSLNTVVHNPNLQECVHLAEFLKDEDNIIAGHLLPTLGKLKGESIGSILAWLGGYGSFRELTEEIQRNRELIDLSLGNFVSAGNAARKASHPGYYEAVEAWYCQEAGHKWKELESKLKYWATENEELDSMLSTQKAKNKKGRNSQGESDRDQDGGKKDTNDGREGYDSSVGHWDDKGYNDSAADPEGKGVIGRNNQSWTKGGEG